MPGIELALSEGLVLAVLIVSSFYSQHMLTSLLILFPIPLFPSQYETTKRATPPASSGDFLPGNLSGLPADTNFFHFSPFLCFPLLKPRFPLIYWDFWTYTPLRDSEPFLIFQQLIQKFTFYFSSRYSHKPLQIPSNSYHTLSHICA